MYAPAVYLDTLSEYTHFVYMHQYILTQYLKIIAQVCVSLDIFNSEEYGTICMLVPTCFFIYHCIDFIVYFLLQTLLSVVTDDHLVWQR